MQQNRSQVKYCWYYHAEKSLQQNRLRWDEKPRKVEKGEEKSESGKQAMSKRSMHDNDKDVGAANIRT